MHIMLQLNSSVCSCTDLAVLDSNFTSWQQANTYSFGFKWALFAAKTISPPFRLPSYGFTNAEVTQLLFHKDTSMITCNITHRNHNWGRRGKRTGQTWELKESRLSVATPWSSGLKNKHRNLISCFSTSQLAVAIFPSWWRANVRHEDEGNFDTGSATSVKLPCNICKMSWNSCPQFLLLRVDFRAYSATPSGLGSRQGSSATSVQVLETLQELLVVPWVHRGSSQLSDSSLTAIPLLRTSDAATSPGGGRKKLWVLGIHGRGCGGRKGEVWLWRGGTAGGLERWLWNVLYEEKDRPY